MELYKILNWGRELERKLRGRIYGRSEERERSKENHREVYERGGAERIEDWLREGVKFELAKLIEKKRGKGMGIWLRVEKVSKRWKSKNWKCAGA